MSSDLLDDWDETFLEQAIQLELDATASRIATQPSTVTTTSLPQPLPQPPFHPPLSANNHSWAPPPRPPPSFSATPASFEAAKEQVFSAKDLSCYGFDAAPAEECLIGFSPPRELSQRFPEKKISGFGIDDCEVIEPGAFRSGSSRQGSVWKDKEIERLKKELGRVSKQLKQMEYECSELQKDKVKKDAHLKSVSSQIEAKNALINSLKAAHTESFKPNDSHVYSQLNSGDHLGCTLSKDKYALINDNRGELTTKILDEKVEKAVRSVGEHVPDSKKLKSSGTRKKEARTERFSFVSELKYRTINDNDVTSSNGCAKQKSSSASDAHRKDVGIQAEQWNKNNAALDVERAQDISNNLLAIWGPLTSTSCGANLISKLFLTCSADFFVLFGSFSLPSDIKLEFPFDESSVDALLNFNGHSEQTAAAAKVSKLYFTIVKLTKEMAVMDDLFEVLVDLCMLDNVTVVHRSLRIMQAIVQIALGCEIHKRGHSLSRNYPTVENTVNNQVGSVMKLFGHKSSPESSNVLHYLQPFKGENHSCIYLPTNCRVSLTETLQRVLLKYQDECIRVEALNVINLLVMASDPYSEREKFGLILFPESLPKLLQKEAGLHVQKQALQLLFLLLNCPQLLMTLCNCHMKGANHVAVSDSQNENTSADVAADVILKGLADCLSCGGSGILELRLQRKTIIVLAFIASFGKAGFQVLLSSLTPEGVNFLELIIQALASGEDEETGGCGISHDLFKERITLMREVLILLNRLASNTNYSKIVLGVLTRNNMSASLIIDFAKKMSCQRRNCRRHGHTKMQAIEAETADLARSFKSRVLAFLGETIS